MTIDQAVISGTIGFLTLAGGIVGIFVDFTKRQALSAQRIETLENEKKELRQDLKDFQMTMFDKMDKLYDIITELRQEVHTLKSKIK